MADYTPPTGAPPPKVPEGWKALWNEQYSEWFFVNTYTKKSQWDKPTEPVYPPFEGGAPDAPPPSYQPGAKAPNVSDAKSSSGPRPGEDDAALAARLQAEENARASGSHSPMPGGSAADYYIQPGGPQQGGQYGMQSPPPLEQQRTKSGGLLGKLIGKGKQAMASGGGRGGHHGGFPFGGGGHGGYPQHGYGSHGYGGYPSHGGGYGGHGGFPMQGHHGGYPGMVPHKKHGGMGAGGAAALGVGGGLLGGMLIADAIDDSQDAAYDQGFDDGGGDMGDMGGGDF